jgi:hypothetical protein
MNVSPASGVSWKSRTWVEHGILRGAEEDPRPFMLVNPGLEMVFLSRSEDGWHPQLPNSFPAAGLQRVGEVMVDRPVRGLGVAWLGSGSVTVRFLIPPFEAYSTSASDSFRSRARELNGLLFGVTHLVNPAAAQLANADPDTLMLTGTILLGWVGLRS